MNLSHDCLLHPFVHNNIVPSRVFNTLPQLLTLFPVATIEHQDLVMQHTSIATGLQHQRLRILLRRTQQVAIADGEAAPHSDRDVQQKLLPIPFVEVFPKLNCFSQCPFSPVYTVFRRGVELQFEIGGHGVVAVDGDSSCLP